MPIHDFVCDDCKVLVNDTTSKGIHKCPVCDEDMRWDCRVAIHGNYRRPIISDSLAMNPEQIPEHRKLFPNIEVKPDGRPIFDNYTDHNNYLDKINMTKQPQKIRAKGKKI